MVKRADTMMVGAVAGAVRYRMLDAPSFANNCHRRLCQRQTGTGSAVNAFIETESDRTPIRRTDCASAVNRQWRCLDGAAMRALRNIPYGATAPGWVTLGRLCELERLMTLPL